MTPIDSYEIMYGSVLQTLIALKENNDISDFYNINMDQHHEYLRDITVISFSVCFNRALLTSHEIRFLIQYGEDRDEMKQRLRDAILNMTRPRTNTNFSSASAIINSTDEFPIGMTPMRYILAEEKFKSEKPEICQDIDDVFSGLDNLFTECDNIKNEIKGSIYNGLLE